MAEEKRTGLSRRTLMKTLGLGGLAVAGLGLPAPIRAAAGEPAKDAPGVMPRRTLGKTGLEVSILNLGGMFDTINNQLLLKQALAWGINFWDTAEAYGNGLSEEGYGRFFARNPEARKQIVVTTKVVPKEGRFDERLDAALSRLKTDYVDLFYLHGISSISEMDGHARDWAEAKKKAGKIKCIGFSTHNNMEDCLLGAAKLDWIDAAMVSYNFRLMHEPKMQEALAACVKAGIGLVAMKTQGGGPVKSGSQAELDMAGRFLEKGFTDKQAKLKAVWANPDIASVCSQMPNLTILAANVAAARDVTALAREDFETLTRFAEATKSDYCAGCASVCGPAMGGVLPVADVMRAMMYYKDYGETQLARELYASLPAALREAPGSLDFSRAEAACPRGLAIAAIAAEAATLLA
ncbi:NADP-dependent oxidoreductase domain protein [Solidesulfovibrio carbinoliphilus subsp. oakridgensis]|uniref:NADP-dependent oxidoreductase domain protein n=1 Tax=Solidesulfovibrio carbinoliphilus subsp. oakridgensis TaxID=694327 RepID=G7QBD8_9BACT|nr:aldo/keto reductase [Solidesulfovibrio carbinoliphilus]EHJ49361.1 NADP-dependent oxidoreductase domain protein [Solidesulfovibrio carbinoliphilus subsp. oakridgensis]